MPKGGAQDFSNIRMGRTISGTEGANIAAAEQIKETLQAMYGAISKGIMPKQILNLDDETLEGLYSQAFMLYNQGKYKDASYIFVVLMLLDPNQFKFQLGAAACLHRLGKYEKAAQVYLLCSALEQQNPLPHFHAADCYIKMQAFPLAEMCLKNAITCCGDKPEHALIKERAILMLKACEQESIALEKELQAQAQKENTQEKSE